MERQAQQTSRIPQDIYERLSTELGPPVFGINGSAERDGRVLSWITLRSGQQPGRSGLMRRAACASENGPRCGRASNTRLVELDPPLINLLPEQVLVEDASWLASIQQSAASSATRFDFTGASVGLEELIDDELSDVRPPLPA
jgi:hypothetical protein